MTARPQDPLISPVTAQELAEWLVGDAADPLYYVILNGSTRAIINYIGYDLISRAWKLTHDYWPTGGTFANPSLSGQEGHYIGSINLPFANLLSVESVTLYGDLSTDYQVRGDNIVLPVRTFSTDNQAAIVVDYTAGYGLTADDVPDDIKMAVMMMASMQYDHRGACSTADALTLSGARELLIPYRNPSMLV